MQRREICRSSGVQRPSSTKVLRRGLVMSTAWLLSIRHWCQSQQHARDAPCTSSPLLRDAFHVNLLHDDDWFGYCIYRLDVKIVSCHHSGFSRSWRRVSLSDWLGWQQGRMFDKGRWRRICSDEVKACESLGLLQEDITGLELSIKSSTSWQYSTVAHRLM